MKKIAIIGYGNQASVWAKNLRASFAEKNLDLAIFLRQKGASFIEAEQDQFKVFNLTDEKLLHYPVVCLLTPDHTHLEILRSIKLTPGALIILAHGFSFSYQSLSTEFPHINFALLAPKAIASELRRNFLLKKSLPAVMSVDGCKEEFKNSATEIVLSIAQNIGITHGPYPVSFIQETQADLLSEQSILCSMLPYSALATFNKLREMGISEELAYFECWYEIKLIANTMVELGPEKFFNLISPNALLGSELAKNLFFKEEFFEKLNQLSENIKNENFSTMAINQDFNQVKKEVLDFWSKQELTKIHKDLSSSLYH